jgi:hypothetical protein
VAILAGWTAQACPRENNQTSKPDKPKNITAMTPKMTQKFDDRLCSEWLSIQTGIFTIAVAGNQAKVWRTFRCFAATEESFEERNRHFGRISDNLRATLTPACSDAVSD